MGKYTKVSERVGVALPEPGTRVTDDQLDELILLSRDDDPLVRRVALKNMCPCHVRRERTDVWDQIFALAEDPDPGVRQDAIHALTDGSPRELAPRVYAALECASTDPDRKLRRYVRNLRTRQRRTGRVNVG
jgi:hypothetical protein